jgi:hypothetical protein
MRKMSARGAGRPSCSTSAARHGGCANTTASRSPPTPKGDAASPSARQRGRSPSANFGDRRSRLRLIAHMWHGMRRRTSDSSGSSATTVAVSRSSSGFATGFRSPDDRGGARCTSYRGAGQGSQPIMRTILRTRLGRLVGPIALLDVTGSTSARLGRSSRSGPPSPADRVAKSSPRAEVTRWRWQGARRRGTAHRAGSSRRGRAREGRASRRRR